MGPSRSRPPMAPLACAVNAPAATCAISNQCTKAKATGAMWALMQSSILKRSIIIDGHKTSVSLEDAFWNELKEIAYRQQATVSKLIKIDETRQQGNLSSAIRLYVLEHIRKMMRSFLSVASFRPSRNIDHAGIVHPTPFANSFAACRHRG
jgi:predicted DNA-binding ribbon-helix-helix protein